MAKERKVRSAGKGPIAGFTTVEYVKALEAVIPAARAIVAVEPVDTGYPARQLALKEALLKVDAVTQDG